MLDKNKFKMEGLKFARLLQSVFRLASMFTVEHRAADSAVKASYEALNALVKQVQTFTFGFMDHRVLLNNILTPDRSLKNLESEFSKRGLGAVTFPAGLTLGGYRKVLSVICTNPEDLALEGGVRKFFEQDPVEGVRIIPGQKGTSSTEETVLEGDPESLMAMQNAGIVDGSAPSGFGLDLLLEAVGMSGGGGGLGPGGGALGSGGGGLGPSGDGSSGQGGYGGGPGGSSGFGGGGAGIGPGGGGGGGFGPGGASGPGGGGGGLGPGGGSGPGGGGGGGGVPGPGGPGGTGGLGGIGGNVDASGNLAAGGTGGGSGTGLGTGPYPSGTGTGGTGGLAPGGAGGTGGGGVGSGGGPGLGAGVGFAKVAAAAVSTNANQVLEIAEKAIVRSFSNPAADPTQALFALSRMLEEFKPEALMPALSAEKRAQLQGKPAFDIAADMMEDVTAQWATQRLAGAKKEELLLSEEEVVVVLQRSLEATQKVDRMLQKLSKLFEKADLPPEFYARIQQELRWQGYSQDQKYKTLIALQRYNAAEFKRLTTYLKEAMTKNRFEQATEMVTHYFSILDLTENELQPAELARAPELLQIVARLQTSEFMQQMANRLSAALMDEHLRGWFHAHVANCLGMVAHSMAPYEDFESVQKIAVELEKSRMRDPDKHHDCCGDALGNLLGPRSIERLIELYSQKREAQRMVLSIVKYMGRPGVEKVFQRLEDEKKASNRMALIRLLGQTGPTATEVARQRLNDDRWYVVRNACFVLNDLKDPELTNELRGVLCHADERVQQAAFNVISKSQAPARAEVLASALTALKPQVLEVALDELRFWKAPDGIPGLERFIVSSEGKQRFQEKAVQAIMAVQADAAIDALARIVMEQSVPMPVRKMIVPVLGKSPLDSAYSALSEVASRAPDDPLAPAAQAALEIEG